MVLGRDDALNTAPTVPGIKFRYSHSGDDDTLPLMHVRYYNRSSNQPGKDARYMYKTRTFTFTPRHAALHLSCDPGTYYDPRTGVTLALPFTTVTTATTNQRIAPSQTQAQTTTTTTATTTTQPQPTLLPLTTPPSTVGLVTMPTTSPSNQSIDADGSEVRSTDGSDGVPAYVYAAAVVGVLAVILLALVAFLIIRRRQRCTNKNKSLPSAVYHTTRAATAAAADLTHESISATQANEYTTNDDVSFSATASVGPVNYCGGGGFGGGGTEGLYDEAINVESQTAASADGMTPPQGYYSPHACVSGPCDTELVNSGHSDVDYVNHDTTVNTSNSNHSYGTLDYAYSPNSDVTRTHPTSDKSDVTAYAYTSHAAKDIFKLPNNLSDDAEDTTLTRMYAKPNKPPRSQPPPPVTMTKTLTVDGETIEMEDNELYGASDD